MSDFTYENKMLENKLETYEWDNVWWEQTNDNKAPRVLYIGDSISCATRRVATRTSDNTVLFDGFGTSKALDNPYFTDSVSIFAKQQGERRAVLFNNGLHGWHLDDETEYARAYENMISFLLKEFYSIPLILLLTTHIADSERDKRVQTRNRVVCELAKKYDLGVVDFYSITKEHNELLSSDGVHLLADGYQLLADELVKYIRVQILK